MVPAAAMKLSPVDRIFTRLGAQDNIVGGASTFLVELQVTSYIYKPYIINRNLTLVLQSDYVRYRYLSGNLWAININSLKNRWVIIN
jgi:hypothetical protein